MFFLCTVQLHSQHEKVLFSYLVQFRLGFKSPHEFDILALIFAKTCWAGGSAAAEFRTFFAARITVKNPTTSPPPLHTLGDYNSLQETIIHFRRL